MYKILKKAIFFILGRGLTVSAKNAFNLATKYGQYSSAQRWEAVDKTGAPIPWYTYPAIDFLNNCRLESLHVYEFGSGNSTRYFLRQRAIVTSVEDNPNWYNKIKKIISDDNFHEHSYILASTKREYLQITHDLLSANIIIIDGSYRAECVQLIIEQIHEGNVDPAIIIFDNSDWYPESLMQIEKKLDYQRVDFCGFGPINSTSWATTFYFNPDKRIKVSSVISVNK